jgi:DNA-binding GntR family transcriptional regulator
MAQVQELQLLGAQQIADEHSGIVFAIRQGDPDEARALTADHLDQARTRLLKWVAQIAPPPQPIL